MLFREAQLCLAVEVLELSSLVCADDVGEKLKIASL